MKNQYPWLRLIALALACLMIFGQTAPVPAQAASSSELKEELDELQDQQEELEAEIEALEGQMNENMSRMEEMVAQKNVLDQQIFLLRQQQENIRQQIAAYNALIAGKQKELDAAQASLDTLFQENRERIRTMEMYGDLSYWSVLAQANNFGELLDRVSMVSEIQKADTRRLAALAQATVQVEQAQQALQEEKNALEQTRQALEKSQAELEAKIRQANEVLDQLCATGREYELWLEQKEQEQTELLNQIAQAEKEYNEAKDKENNASRPSGGTPPSSVTDGITWLIPINYWYFSSAYGMRDHPIDGVPKFHHGVDLAAPEGTPIYASRSGTVTVASKNDTNGVYVTINHGDGFSTMYLHMTHYTVYAGQYVQAGQKIGECGNTGASKGNHLHFGIYYNGSSVNPAQYIDFY